VIVLELQMLEDAAGVILQCDDTEAMRVSQIMRFPWTPNCKVCVTFNVEGLDRRDLPLDSLVTEGDRCQLPLVDFED